MNQAFRNGLGLAAVLAFAFAFAVPPANAGSTVQDTASRLSAENVEAENDFSPASGIQCAPGGGGDHFAIRCHADLFDSERSAQVASIDFLIYDSQPDFGAEDAALAGAIHGMHGQWEISDTPHVTITGPNGPFTAAAVCRQALGAQNSPAFCLMDAGVNVIVMAEVAPAVPATDNLDTDPDGPTYQDTDRATTLAIMAIRHVLKSSQAASLPSVYETWSGQWPDEDRRQAIGNASLASLISPSV